MGKPKAYITGDRSPASYRWAVQPPAILIQSLPDRDLVQAQPWEWDTVRRLRSDALRATEALYGAPWKKLYRQGYRCHRVKLAGSILVPNARPPIGSKAWIRVNYPGATAQTTT